MGDGIGIGIDLGGTTIIAGIVAENGVPLSSNQIQTHHQDGEALILERMVKLAKQSAAPLIKKRGRPRVAGIGIPGLVTSNKGPIVFAPNVGWKNVDPVTYLEKELGCPVFLYNDAACAAIAESRLGHGQQYESLLFLTLGTGIGGAFIWNGKLFDQHGPYGSELGHIPLRQTGIPCSCGLPGCFQQYGSAVALIRQTREAMGLHRESIIWDLCDGEEHAVSTKTVFQALTAGDQTAMSIVAQFATNLAEGMAGLINIFRPETVVLGGGLSNAGEALLQPIRERLPQFIYASELTGAPSLLCSKLGSDAGMIGAALTALMSAEQ
jgi:glucokinase